MNGYLHPGDNVARGQDMDRQIPDRIGAAVFSIVAALGLAGCDSVFTIHSIAAVSDGPSAVPDISGLWVPSDPQLAGLVLRIAAEDHDIGRCRNVDIHVLSAYTSPEVPKACDELDEQGRSAWITYTLLTPPRPHEAADAADTPPSPRN
jgi:hypothetical protein